MLYVVLVILNKAEKSSKFNFRGDGKPSQILSDSLYFEG